MIKVSELRKGNLIMLETDNFDFKDTIFRLNNVGQYGCTMSEINKSAFITKNTKFLKPIPLTKEWLKNIKEYIHTEKTKTIERYALGKIIIDDYRALHFAISTINDTSIDVFLLTMFKDDAGSGVYIKLRIEYIHQLQNYYYFNKLTGEELTIKTKRYGMQNSNSSRR